MCLSPSCAGRWCRVGKSPFMILWTSLYMYFILDGGGMIGSLSTRYLVFILVKLRSSEQLLQGPNWHVQFRYRYLKLVQFQQALFTRRWEYDQPWVQNGLHCISLCTTITQIPYETTHRSRTLIFTVWERLYISLIPNVHGQRTSSWVIPPRLWPNFKYMKYQEKWTFSLDSIYRIAIVCDIT